MSGWLPSRGADYGDDLQFYSTNLLSKTVDHQRGQIVINVRA